MKRIIFLLTLTSAALFSLEKAPWFNEVYEFHLTSKYTYFLYDKVNGAIEQLNTTQNNHLLYFDLSFSPSMQWSIDSDLEFIETPRQSFGFRSVAFQPRYLLRDDIIGDPFSIAIGANFRVISNDSLKDVSTLYHSHVDFEFNLAIGKEFAHLEYWRFRVWGNGVVGFANNSSPWLRAKVAIEGNSNEKRKWALFTEIMHGYGKENTIDIENFNGYAKIRQKSIDLGFNIGHKLSVLGTLRFEYKRRLLAKLCPEKVNFFSVEYLLPFSF
ncbi:MAG: hypothetical protein K1060chlam5_00226 [Candidatus Anoxychlamydiales bacterium]|nr:hypothetical protein [Candidatus Anoxychlamydiales bacterium]